LQINPHEYFLCRWDRPWVEFLDHFDRFQGIQGSACFTALHEDPEVIEHLAQLPRQRSRKKSSYPILGWSLLHDLTATVADQVIASRAVQTQAKKVQWMPRPILPYTLARQKVVDNRLVAGVARGVERGKRLNPKPAVAGR
jgi:hypothetical protein